MNPIRYYVDMYRDRLRTLLSPAERKIFTRLNSPQKIQDFLDTLSINFEIFGETYMSPCRVLRERTAHCFEGALFAAAALAYHGEKPLLLDLKTAAIDSEDHVVALFRQNGLWGAMSKTNHATLRYRDPIYKTVRELAMSYFHEYILPDGRKTLRAFSRPFDLTRFDPEDWVTSKDELIFLVNALDDSRHIPVASSKQFRTLRKATPFEIKTTAVVEWKEPRKKH